jgi:hypothetical protein
MNRKIQAHKICNRKEETKTSSTSILESNQLLDFDFSADLIKLPSLNQIGVEYLDLF